MLRLLLILVLSSGWHVDAFLPRFPLKVANKFGLNTIHDPETERIVGGEEASQGEFPWQASMQRIKANGDSSHFCGASIYSSDCVVTAAHCLSAPPAKMQVFVGSQKLQSNGVYYKIEGVKKHEGYNPTTINNDIGIVKLKTPMNFSDTVKPISLHDNADIPEGTECTCSGWGTTSEGGSIANQLRKVTIPVIATPTCKKYYGDEEITDSMLCAGLAEGGKDSCQGDSGGPLIVNSKLVGVVSWGYGCARPNYPGVYTSIARVKAWIESACANKP